MSNVDAERQRRVQSLAYHYGGQPKVEIVACNLCGDDRFVGLSDHDRYGFPARASACLRCGLVFLNPVMTAEAYREFYVDTYRELVSAYHGRRIDGETIQDEQECYSAKLSECLAPFIRSRDVATLLDIGGSTGVIAHQLVTRFGLAATVLDPAPLEIEQAERLGLETIIGLIEEYEPSGRTFDMVTLCQTVDHLLDISGALEKIRRLVSSRGIFVVDIVDFRAAYLRSWSIEEAIKIDHPYYLTEPTMEAYLHRIGFEVLRKEYERDQLHIGYVCQPTMPRPKYVPPSTSVEILLREVRLVQNTPRGIRF